jgi:hypothetical protein
MIIRPLSVAAFVMGFVAGIVQLAYLSGIFSSFSDLSADTPTVYAIYFAILLWAFLTLLVLVRYGIGGLWTLLVAPFALIGPGLLIWFSFNCYAFSSCP